MYASKSLRRLALAASLSVFPGSGLAQEACLKGYGYPQYPGLAFTLGDGFVAKGGEEVRVTHMGFLGQVYNNDGITPRKVGVPYYIGKLYVIDPVTGEERFLFQNQRDWETHANDSGKVVSLGVYPKGAPLVFKYVNVDGKTAGYKTFPRYSGDNAAGVYDFNADPILKDLVINGKPKPVSGGTWNWEGHDYNMWCVAADVPGTGEKQFQFEDADDRIFNDIVFRVSGVALVSETRQLGAPVITGNRTGDGGIRISIATAAGDLDRGATIFYTLDGSVPAFDSLGNPAGTTRVYSEPLTLSRTATVKARAFKPSTATLKYVASPTAEYAFTLDPRKLSAPTATPPGAVWTAPLTVTLDQAEGAPIRYRLCDPNAACPDPDADAPLYAGPVVLAAPKVIKAIAIRPPDANSDVAVFAFGPGKWKAPTANPAGGGVNGSVAVTLAQPEGARIYYVQCAPGAACPDPTAASAAYAGPLTLTGAVVLKAIAIQPPLQNSDAASWTFTPAYAVAEAVYLDRDGDGRIESARIVLNGRPAALPSALSLEDPFRKGSKASVSGGAIGWAPDASPGALIAAFPPFSAGTAFAPGPYGLFPAPADGYPSGPFPIRDGAGPVALVATAKVSLDSGAVQKLRVRFSEPLQSAEVTGTLPFRIKRAGEDITSRLKASHVEKVGDSEYEYAFGPDIYPVPGDSLAASPAAKDALGNPANQAGLIPVGGDKPVLRLKLAIAGGGCRRGRALNDPHRLQVPISVIAPRSPGVKGCAEAGAPTCLDCLTGEWKRADPGRYDAEALPPGPELRVTTQGPFRFDLAFYTTLGEFVNRAAGTVTAEMLKAVAPDAKGIRAVDLQWYPVRETGEQAATGAYIAKGTLTLLPDPGLSAAAGLPVSVVSRPERVQVRFGYLRD